MPSVITELTRLLDEFVKKTRLTTNALPCLTLDDNLEDRDQSPAIVELDREKELVWWKPQKHGDFSLLDNLETGLELPLHRGLKEFYGAYWSEGICCQSPIGKVELIQVWNKSDLEALQENLLGHAFMKMKKRQPLTFFIGVGSGEDMITLDNADGSIWLEVPGRRPHRQLTKDLATFLENLEVTLQPYGT